MVGRRRKHSGPRLAGNHQRCWIWGRNAVLESLAAGRWTPLSLLAADRTDPQFRQLLEQRAAERHVPIEWTSYDALTDRCQSTEHQGLMARMPEYPYATLDDALLPQKHAPFLVLLEGIQDPHNFGAIIRSAEVFGADAVIVGQTAQCGVTPHVARASAGAVNHLPIARTPNLVDAIDWLRSRGLHILGATGSAHQPAHQAPLTAPTAIVVGNEGSGLSPELLAHCDQLIRIPQAGQTESLNAAVATGILCYEIHRQRTPLNSDP